MKIYTNKQNGQLYVDMCAITAAFAKVGLEEVVVSEEERAAKEWKQKSMTGKFPCLETENGFLIESAAIARFIASQGASNLNGNGPWENAQVNQWIDILHTGVIGHMLTVIKAIFGWVPIENDAFNNAVKELKEQIKLLNTHLQGKEWIVGNSITVADICMAVTLIPAYQTTLDGGFRKAMPNVSAWLDRFVHMPEVVGRLGHVKFCAKPIKPVAVVKKEEPKKVAAVAKKEATEEGEPLKKEKNPLDLLPPSKFVLPDFKTYFVNLPNRRDGLFTLFEDYDPEGYSIYFVHYDKAEGEGTILYQFANLMNGFLQRIDNFRVHCFAMMAILGEEPKLEIQGVWLFRGKGIPQEMIDHPQFEYYQKRELDVSKLEDRVLIGDFFCAKPGHYVNGMVVQECKMHK